MYGSHTVHSICLSVCRPACQTERFVKEFDTAITFKVGDVEEMKKFNWSRLLKVSFSFTLLFFYLCLPIIRRRRRCNCTEFNSNSVNCPPPLIYRHVASSSCHVASARVSTEMFIIEIGDRNLKREF